MGDEVGADHEATAERVLEALRQYDRQCDAARRLASTLFWGHPGAFVAEAEPTRGDRLQVVQLALREAEATW